MEKGILYCKELFVENISIFFFFFLISFYKQDNVLNIIPYYKIYVKPDSQYFF